MKLIPLHLRSSVFSLVREVPILQLNLYKGTRKERFGNALGPWCEDVRFWRIEDYLDSIPDGVDCPQRSMWTRDVRRVSKPCTNFLRTRALPLSLCSFYFALKRIERLWTSFEQSPFYLWFPVYWSLLNNVVTLKTASVSYELRHRLHGLG